MLTMQASKGLNINYVGILISPNPGCAKLNLTIFFCNTLALALANFFPGENFPLYGTWRVYARGKESQTCMHATYNVVNSDYTPIDMDNF